MNFFHKLLFDQSRGVLHLNDYKVMLRRLKKFVFTP